ncbi:MAG: SPASM domain-containing protein [Deltaproteobacteria bacterium]|nr:SPASM domain-containing protein [Deltaproteobacteria bacterium]
MHVTLHLSYACNMDCGYCYAAPKVSPTMTETIARQALLFASSTARRSCGVVFFGGEPLLHKPLIKSTVRTAREIEGDGPVRFYFKATTNGLLLDDDYFAFAKTNDVLTAMSFDGVRAAHDRHRRLANGGSCFDVLSDKLNRLLAASPYAPILTTVNPDTAEYLYDSISLLIERGARYIVVSLNYAAPWTMVRLNVLEEQYRRLAEAYVRWTDEGRKFYLSLFDVKLSSHINDDYCRKERCALAQKQLSVDPAGYLYPCVQFAYAGPESEWCIGHVETGIDEDARGHIREAAEAVQEPCSTCSIERRCRHTCGCLNWQTTGSIQKVSPVLCPEEKILVRLADEIGHRLYKKRNPRFIQKHYNVIYPVLSLLEDAAERPSKTDADASRDSGVRRSFFLLFQRLPFP